MKLSYQIATPEVEKFSSVTYLQGNFEKNVEFIKLCGYDAVEIVTTAPKRVDWVQIRDILDAYGMTVPLVCTGALSGKGYNLSSADGRIREKTVSRVRELIDVASFFGADINAGSIKGSYEVGVPKHNTETWAEESFIKLCDYAASKNVCIDIETASFFWTDFMNTCDSALAMINNVNRKNLCLMMDTFHFHIEEKNIINTIKKYSAFCRHVHLADSNRKYPGAGSLNFKKIISTFHDCGYNGAFTVEVRFEPDIETTVREGAKHVLPIFEQVYEYRPQL